MWFKLIKIFVGDLAPLGSTILIWKRLVLRKILEIGGKLPVNRLSKGLDSYLRPLEHGNKIRENPQPRRSKIGSEK